MQQDKLNYDLQQLSGYVYKNNNFQKPDGWSELGKSEGKFLGFYAETFFKENQIVISFRGSDTEKIFSKECSKDIFSDANMGISLLPAQIINAQNYYNKIKKEFPNQEIVLTGHSLGGSLAQIIGSETGCKTVTFGAYGTANLLDYQVKNSDNITNYGNVKDPVFVANISNQIGKTLIIDDYVKNTNKIVKNSGNGKVDINNHAIENMGDLSKAVEYKGQNLQTNETLILKANIEKDIDFKDVDLNRIFTREEIKEMSESEYSKKENIINQQLKNFGTIPTKAEAEEKVKSGDLIWVDSYTRDDGTSVSGYYRRR